MLESGKGGEKGMRKSIWSVILVCFALLLITGMAFAEEASDYKLNMQMQLEKVEKPVTLLGDIAASEDGFKLGLRYRAMPNVYVAMHMGLKEDHPFDLEVVYRAHTGMDYIRVYGGIGLDLKESALFSGYLVGGVEAAVVFVEMNYHTDGGKLVGWGGLRIPIF